MLRIERNAFKSTHTPLFALLALLLLLLTAALISNGPARIEAEFGGATIQLSADNSWSLFPGDCLEVRWQVEGIESIYIDGQGRIGWGELTYCPSFAGASPEFLITARDGAARTFKLDTHFLLSELLSCILFVTLLFLFALAVFYFVSFRREEPPPLTRSTLAVYLAAVFACLLGTAGDIFSIPHILEAVGHVFESPAWQLLGVALGALIFIPLMIQELRCGIRTKASADLLAITAFILILLLLYSPFGFESIGHWEEWVSYAYLEGRPSKIGVELVSRSWILVPHALAMQLSPDSFAGFHLVNLLMFWAKMTLLYGVIRQLKFSPCIAFLSTVLFLVYPVNDSLMSLRSLQMTFGKTSLLAGAYLVLDYRSNPSRLHLLGIWIAMLFAVVYEIGYVLILVAPILWLRRPRWSWRNFNLTAIWYLFPAAKVAYLLLLISADQLFYASRMLSAGLVSERSLLDSFAYYLGIVGNVYRQTFATGWREALTAVSQNVWIAPTVAALAITGFVAIYLARDLKAGALPSRRQAIFCFICGFLFVLPSIGVLMWFERYNQDLWRMYVYVPIGASVAVISLLVLVSSLLRDPRIRKLIVGAACLLLMFPATSRLFVQKAQIDNSANAKASVLRQTIEQAPTTDPDTFLILLTDMTGSELRARGISQFRTNMLDSAMYVLYGGEGPRITFLCMIGVRCHLDDVDLSNFNLNESTDFSNLVIFRLHEDLTVELLRELPPKLGLDDRGTYDPERLIDFSAPLPPRAVSMLGAAARSN